MEPYIRTIHGHTVVDPYFGLRDRNNPETLRFLEAENQRTEEAMKPTLALQDELYREMLARIEETDMSAPVPMGKFEYYSRTQQGKQYPDLCRRGRGSATPEQVILDCNALAEGHEFFALAFDRVSPDGNFLAFAMNTDGDEVYTLRFKDLRTGEVLPEEAREVYYSAAWGLDARTFFYTTLDSAKRPYRLWKHAIGAGKPDELVYEEPDGRFNVSIERSRSGQFLFLMVDSHTTTEVRYGDGVSFQLIAPRVQGVEYYAEHQGDSIYIRTNENAKNFKLMKLAGGEAVEVIPNRDDVVLEGMAGFRDHLVLVERKQGLRQLRIDDYLVEFDEPAFTVSLDRNEEYDTQVVRFSYSSLVTPRSVYDYDMNSRERELKKRYAVLGSYDPSNYVSERIFAGDVPISLVYRKGLVRDGSNPALLYGYGAYGIITDPSFSSERISLLDRGFMYAIAHIRGSADMGRKWYDEGKLLKKRNTFDDFIACAEHLIGLRYTSPENLAIIGGSAGGLLMGAVTNMRPELFAVVVAHVPFVDVVNTMLDPTLPLTVTEYEEWGNPNEKAYYEYIRSYAPYENVKPGKYPSILVTAGLNDPRVPYWEPAKWVARLREVKTDGNLVLLKTILEAGHGGPSGRYERLREKAFEYAFILSRLTQSSTFAIV